MTSMPALADKDEQGKDITASEQYKKNIKVYHTWFKRDRFVRCTMLSCMHDDLMRKF